jgi:hypothetical protein
MRRIVSCLGAGLCRSRNGQPRASFGKRPHGGSEAPGSAGRVWNRRVVCEGANQAAPHRTWNIDWDQHRSPWLCSLGKTPIGRVHSDLGHDVADNDNSRQRLAKPLDRR